MRIRLLESSVSGGAGHFATSYVIDDTVAVDAGCLGLWGSVADQARIRHLFLTHSHADHIATLPIFVENAYEGRADCVTVWGNAEVERCIREDLFNDRVWPDFLRLSTPAAPFLKLARLEAEQPVTVEGLRLTPVAVRHQVPTFGFVIERGDSAVVIVSDTAPTERIWAVAQVLPHLRAVFLEAALPDRLDRLAQVAGHLTPCLFRDEVARLERDVPVIAVHLKPRYHDEIAAELRALGLPRVELGQPGKEYRF